jgi:hypothetical protein
VEKRIFGGVRRKIADLPELKKVGHKCDARRDALAEQ